ncbi:MAG: hypothetical protein LBC61_02980 [Candidatus Peribacteria bacterium]|nr:hypothetical protein [Candidatus Peribacteria bacterium]
MENLNSSYVKDKKNVYYN